MRERVEDPNPLDRLLVKNQDALCHDPPGDRGRQLIQETYVDVSAGQFRPESS